MKTSKQGNSFNRVLTGLTLLFLCLLSIKPPAHAAGYGDDSSTQLMIKAWDAYGKGEHPKALEHIQRCIEYYFDTAIKQQGRLSDFASKEDAKDHWALNDVGTCLYIKGCILGDLGQKKEQRQTYQTLIEKLSFAQAWDKQGWFWRPAEVAKEAMKAQTEMVLSSQDSSNQHP